MKKLPQKEMDYSPPTPLATNPNPTCKTTKNVLHIGGIQVEFPYQPYGTQLAFMNRVISTLDRAQSDGHCHALLESPTGTGKSLSLLCSVLAWQQNFKLKNLNANFSLSDSKPNPEAKSDPINHGGGFLPETQPSYGSLETGSSAGINGQNKKKKLVPTIFYASRTHSQLRQVIQEYRKTAYRVPMAVLASRKHYCTNTNLRGADNIDEQCKLMLKNREVGCLEFKNVNKVKGHPSLQKGGCHEAHDIEDLVKVGQVVKGCSYFAARSMAEDAELVFCPYNYIVSPLIRRAMEVDIQGAIIILDEAHNIEDVARDAGSIDVEEDALIQLQTELEQLRLTDAMTYQPLVEMIQDILSWMNQRKSSLEKREFQHYFSCWTGIKALKELEKANLSQKCFPILQGCATKAIKAASDGESELACLSGLAATVLEGLFSSFNYLFSGNGIHANDYLLVIQRYVKRDGDVAGGLMHSLSLWCLNPAVVFSDVADASISVILTSGTLSPMNSFSSELGVHFGTSLEAPHVIDVESQLWAAVISRGPENYPLNASYRTAEAYAFQDALGTSLEEICKVVPGGCLVFFPSYKLMDKLCNRWQETGQWSRLNAQKSLFIEPRGGNQDALEPVLKGYYDSIHRGSKPVTRRKMRGKRSDLNECKEMVSSQNSKKKGAAFLAVCRGKISEGIDFSDDNARVVIVVGIPFPNIHDIQVAQKKKFNDMYKLSKNLLSGNEWYCNQAFRALNQATGRCIRHRFDYGAIILLDERFCEERNRLCISKWFRKSVRQYDSFERSLEELKSFFSDVKDRIDKKAKSSQLYDAGIEVICSGAKNHGITAKKNQKEYRSDQSEWKLSSGSLVTEKSAFLCQSSNSEIEYDSLCSQIMSNVKPSVLLDGRDNSGCMEFADLECDTAKGSSWSRNPSIISIDDPDLTIVKETLGLNGSTCNLENNAYSSLTTVPSPSELLDLSCSPMFVMNSGSAPTSTSLVVTPERMVDSSGNCIIGEKESPYNLSANSYSQKRRKSLGLSSDSLQAEQCFTPSAGTPGCVSMASSMTLADTKSRIITGSEVSDSLKEFGDHGFSRSSLSPEHLSPVMDKRLQIFCSACKSPLGLPRNNFFVTCSLSSSSKVYLKSLWKEKLDSINVSGSSIPVLISDVSSVDRQLCERNNEAASGGPSQGIWCKEDGCVFNRVNCPFCNNLFTCLGVQVMATDASNIWLQNKILFYSDLLEIKNPTASKDENLSPSSGSCTTRAAGSSSIEKFAYLPPQNSGGWRTKNAKMQLPKRGLLSTPES